MTRSKQTSCEEEEEKNQMNMKCSFSPKKRGKICSRIRKRKRSRQRAKSVKFHTKYIIRNREGKLI